MITLNLYNKSTKDPFGALVPAKTQTFCTEERDLAHKAMEDVDLDIYDVVLVYHDTMDKDFLTKARMSPLFDLAKPEFAPFEGNRAEYHGEA